MKKTYDNVSLKLYAKRLARDLATGKKMIALGRIWAVDNKGRVKSRSVNIDVIVKEGNPSRKEV